MNKKPKQNEISQSYLKGSDLHKREKIVLKDASDKLGFITNKLLGRSSWWTSKEIGAFHYLGMYKGKNAILKIQGVKPAVSEIYMINSFQKANKSKIIRPPHLYAYIPWDAEKRYEALILEDTGNQTVINPLTKQIEIDEFFNLYEEYRNNCLKTAWIEKPDLTLSENIKVNFENWRKTSFKLYPTHPLRKEYDENLIDAAINVLTLNYQGIEPQFMHGHFSATDLYRVNEQIVLLSNLYWSYRNPYRDAVFGYHWFMLSLSDIPDISAEKIDEQKKLWLDKIYSLPKNDIENKLLNLALLERAAAGLNLDALSINPDLEVSKYLVETTRKEVERLIQLSPRK